MRLQLFSLFFLYVRVSSQCGDDVECLVNLINEANKNASTYQFPVSAEEYGHTSKKIKDFGEYDFIIVGSGASGSVVANRLSENCNWKILLLEAGTYGNDLTDIPSSNVPDQLSKFNWGFQSVQQTTCCLGLTGKVCPYPRGKGIGGSTLINGLVYARGSSEDYDKWYHRGNPGWSYEELLPLFKKSENFVHNDIHAPVEPQYHGITGPLNVQYRLPRSPQLNAFLEANKQIGYQILDYNGKSATGASASQINTRNGKREDDGTAFVKRFRHRKNLKVMTDSYATKINFFPRSNRASGVTFSHNRQLYTARTSKEVIISGGAIQSPQLLMLSGIGPRDHLKSLGIPLLKHLEVGSNLIDHPAFFGLSFNTNYTEPTKSLTEQVEDYLQGYGTLTTADNHQGVGFYNSSFTVSPINPDIEIMFIPSRAINPDLSQKVFQMTDESYQATWGDTNFNTAYWAFLIGLHPESVGTLRLKSKNPYDYPLIDPRMFSDRNNKDIQVLYEGVQLAIRLAETPALRRINTTLHSRRLPACGHHKYLSREYWYCVIRQISDSVYHPINTCSMGPDPEKGAVVDHELKVHGIRGLRVADASVIPLPISGHPNAPCVVVGEKAAELLKKQYE